MSLSKFFRRYSRILLMVFMSLLLIVFLVGDVLQRAGSSRRNPQWTIGHAFDQQPISTHDVQAAESQRNLLTSLAFANAGLVDSLDLHLLIEEARRMGVHIGRDQAKEALTRRLGVQQAQQLLESVQQRRGLRYDRIYDDVAEWLAVLQLMALQAEVSDPSEPRAELTYRDLRQEAVIELAVLDAHAFISSVPEPAEEKLQAFFEQTKSREESHTEDELQFGYVWPDRVCLEYLTVDPAAIQSKVRISKKEVRDYWERNKESYKKTVKAPPSTQSGQPARPKTTRVQMTFDEARERVREHTRREKAILEAQRLVYDVRHEAYRAWRTSERDETGYRVVPPEGTVVSFEALRDRFSDRYEVIYEKTSLLDREGIVNVFDTRPEYFREQMGSQEPMYREGQIETPISELALRVKGILTPDPEDRLPALNLLEPSPVLISKKLSPGMRQPIPYQAVVYRVVRVEPSGPPDSLDDVRAELTEDYKLLKAHELAGQHARELGEQARVAGLAAAVEQAEGLKTLLVEAEQAWTPPSARSSPLERRRRPQYVKSLEPEEVTVTRSSRRVGEIDSTEKLPREVFALAAAQPEGPSPARDVVATDVADLFKWVIVELKEIKPLYRGEFDQRRDMLLRIVAEQTRPFVMWDWLRSENVRLRTGFTEAKRAAEVEPASGAEQPAESGESEASQPPE